MATTPAPPASVSALLDAADRVGVFPAAALQIFEALRDQQVEGRRLAMVVGRDPVLTGRLLKTANSPFYGRQRRVGTIEEALVVLGFHVVRDLAMSFALVGMSKTASPATAGLWRHMLTTGVLAASFSRHVRNVEAASALVLGTMHDIGELVLLEVEPQRHAQVLARMQPDDARTAAAERMIFGIDHAALGAACLLQWGLPNAYAQIVRHHHEPNVDPSAPLDGVVRLADAGSWLLERGSSPKEAAEELAEHPANQYLGVRSAQLLHGLERVRSDLAALTTP